MTTNTWTIAYRKGSANHFKRATNWGGTWAQAREVAALFEAANPGLQVWYVPTAASDTHPEDRGNILMDSGKRIKIRETGTLSPEILAGVPDAAEAQARWTEACERSSGRRARMN